MIQNSSNYLTITEKQLNKFFTIKENKLFLKNSRARPLKTDIPFKLNEDIAKICGMMLDGSLNKNLYNVMFSQKKDKNKVKEFGQIINKVFNLKPIFRNIRDDTPIVTFGNKTLGTFFNKCLDITKSDQKGKIPGWLWNSPKTTIREYLRYAFAMEGSVSHYLKGSEIKFHSVDLSYLKDLKKLLKIKFDINFKIYRYYIKNYGWKYYLYICNQKEITKFQKIGFALKTHQKRLNDLISHFKNKAWEITIVNIPKVNKKIFHLSDINKLFPYLCKRAIHHRINELINKGYIQGSKQGYHLTNKGHKTALSLKNKVKTTRLRTYPKINETNVINFLNQKKQSYTNQIARELKINPKTIGDTLKRLVQKGKIQHTNTDKFQRKFYELSKDLKVNNSNSAL